MFHFVFLRALIAKGEDKAQIAVKGGRNLRFYFASVRYSEDIGYDAYVSNVVAFLEPVHAAIFEDRSAWDAMLDNVVSRMAALA